MLRMTSPLSPRCVSVLTIMAAVVLLPIGQLTGFVAAQVATPAGDPCAAVLAAGTPVPEAPMSGGDPAAFPFDLVFIDAMTAHHQAAVEMADIALVRAERPEVIGLAQAIRTSQATEIDQMAAWRDQWYPDAPPVPDNVVSGLSDEGMAATGGMGGAGAGSMADEMRSDLVALCSGAEPFDLAFLRVMIPHHQSAVGMATLAQSRAEHPELATLADSIIASQSAEIVQMTAWLAEWYPEGGTASPMAGM